MLVGVVKSVPVLPVDDIFPICTWSVNSCT